MESLSSQGIVWSVFPLCGKTYATNLIGVDAVDSDSSNFSWIMKNGKKIRNPDFPKNYIEHIKDAMTKHAHVFVSSHKEVRDALTEAGIIFNLVYPERRYLSAWIDRYNSREFNGFPLEVLINNWEKWHDELESQKCNLHILFGPEDYLSNLI